MAADKTKGTNTLNIFVTIWNRFSWAIPLLDDFAKAGLTPVVIDNNSTYEPCRQYLDNECKYQVIRRKSNDGAWAFFTTELYQQYKDRYFMISDSDQSITGIPSDWVDVLMKGLEETEDSVWKSGLSQRIDDLPRDNPYATEIYDYEKNFYSNINRFGYYKVWMDLGIAVYDRTRRSETPIKDSVSKDASWYAAVRAPLPYVSRHLDWYLTPESFREEDIYYLKAVAEHNAGKLTDKWHEGWLYNWVKKYKTDIALK